VNPAELVAALERVKDRAVSDSFLVAEDRACNDGERESMEAEREDTIKVMDAAIALLKEVVSESRS